MNRKSINTVLQNKLNDWLKSINDEKVKTAIKKDVIITGGCIASMLLDEKINDFDIYFKTRKTTVLVAKYYVSKFNSCVPAFVLDGSKKLSEQSCSELTEESATWKNLGNRVKIYIPSDGVAKSIVEPAEKTAYMPIFLSSNAVTLSDKIQLVVRFFGKPHEIHENYDFVHCTNYWTPEEKLVLHADAMESLLSKHLKYTGSKYPLCSIIRTRKFVKRGWHINAGQYLKMCFQLSKLDLTDVYVLEDQLIGVDTAYFSVLIKALQKRKKEHSDFIIDEGYISELIDKIFN